MEPKETEDKLCHEFSATMRRAGGGIVWLSIGTRIALYFLKLIQRVEIMQTADNSSTCIILSLRDGKKFTLWVRGTIKMVKRHRAIFSCPALPFVHPKEWPTEAVPHFNGNVNSVSPY